MGAEFIRMMTRGSSGGEATSEFDLTLMLPGDIDSLRPRLMAALERIGYRVLSEQPLHAKRGPRGWGVWSAALLDFPTTLLLGFKSSGEHATLVTFSYTVKHAGIAWLSKGDMQTLTREAEAVAALVTQRVRAATCAACGTESMPDSRFCRRCGAPIVTPEPAELEVLRLTAGARAAHQTTVASAVMVAFLCLALLASLLTLPLVDELPKGLKVLLIFSGISGALGWMIMLFGMRRLHRTLNPKPMEESLPVSRQRAIESPRTTVLPPQHIPVSVTETTTELLQPTEEPSPIPAQHRSRDTA